jgi:hypothetical protein
MSIIAALDESCPDRPPLADLTLSQQLALFNLMQTSRTAAAVAMKLSHSVAAGFADYCALADRGLARRGPRGHEITLDGNILGMRLANYRANEWKVPVSYGTPGCYQRRTYSSQATW